MKIREVTSIELEGLSAAKNKKKTCKKRTTKLIVFKSKRSSFLHLLKCFML